MIVSQELRVTFIVTTEITQGMSFEVLRRREDSVVQASSPGVLTLYSYFESLMGRNMLF